MRNTRINKDMLQWAALILIVGVLWFTGWHKPIVAGAQKMILATGIIQPAIPKENSGQNTPAVDMMLIDENRRPLNLSSFRGKTVFLNFWATWCPPCVAEMPGIEALYTDVNKQGIEFVMISIDDDFDKAMAFKMRKNYTFPIYRIANDIPFELQSDQLPTTFVIDPNGVVQLKQSGMAEYDTDEFKAFLQRLNVPKP